ncbi:MAG TPA: bifunctional aspartate transaminase/aspartate 4-decarboxylase [Roseomonas sp.]|nr:bifunctional aspartate transaminase/aspartate 4-decarboxylase [Roseomonas sp.]
MEAKTLRDYERMSPFEIKDELIRLAKAAGRRGAFAFLNAGRGNPNWVATTPREAFFLLGQFALSESRRVMDLAPGIGGMPQPAGIAARFGTWLDAQPATPGTAWLRAMLSHVTDGLGFRPDDVIHELADAVIGDSYPAPGRMLTHVEAIIRAYLHRVLCGGQPIEGAFDLLATEGATAGMSYLLRSLKANRLLLPGDSVAIGCPIFSPYLELAALEDFGLRSVHIEARPEDRFQFTDAALARLEDPRVKAFFLVNPGNPTAVALDDRSIERIAAIIRGPRPDLILVTDDVYASFVDGFRSLLGEVPRNTIGVYSFSKFFGATGWRLGVIALHRDTILDAMLAAQPDAVKRALDARYAALTPHPSGLRMIDRMLADSRDVAMNHTAGLSTPQQAMMALFALVELMDRDECYRDACRAILRRRSDAMLRELGITGEANPLGDDYYGLVDVEYWIRTHLGEEVAAWMKRHVHPLDIVFRLAEEHGIVLLPGGGFHAPEWSARVSFANLSDDTYGAIGRAVRAIAETYLRAYRASPDATRPPKTT